jgi:choline dehydrogenase-like flavoprotein
MTSRCGTMRTRRVRLSTDHSALAKCSSSPFPNTHNMGTCRQSEKARDGVCNKYGQTHDIPNLFISDGSQFTSGGAENRP